MSSVDGIMFKEGLPYGSSLSSSFLVAFLSFSSGSLTMARSVSSFLISNSRAFFESLFRRAAFTSFVCFRRFGDSFKHCTKLHLVLTFLRVACNQILEISFVIRCFAMWSKNSCDCADRSWSLDPSGAQSCTHWRMCLWIIVKDTSFDLRLFSCSKNWNMFAGTSRHLASSVAHSCISC